MTASFKCPDCDKVRPTEYGVRRHQHLAHGTSFEESKNGHKPIRLESKSKNGHKPIRLESKPKQQKKPVAKIGTDTPQLQYCPCCGTNLAAVALALQAVGGLR